MPSKSTLRRSALAIAASSSLANAGPCDIYGNCVAAHATTRALYNAYNGPLYQVKRDSDKSTIDIKPVSAGGVANAAAQDTFCSGTTCLITQVYDQSGRGNHLTQAPPGGAASGPEAGGYDNLASAIGAPVTLGGKKAYGVFISPGTGYRNDKASGTATGDGAQGMYAVLDGTHYNDGCCFDYGNAETNNKDTGNGHMEAIYYGDNTIWGSGAGSGPWLMADLENGLFSGRNVKQNTNDPTITDRFFTAAVKGQPNQWALRGGNAASGGLSTYYNGVRPDASGYNPMSKEGAILLGIGGDNSISGQGTFYEGVMTSSFPSDDTENKVQANIVAAGYAKAAMTSGPAVTVGKTYSFKATTPGYDTRYLAASSSAAGSAINTQVLTTSSSTASKQAASWTVRTGLGNADCVSFENKQTPGSYLRHYNFALRLDPDDGSKSMHEDATFCPQTAFNSKGTNAFRAWGYPTRFVRHVNNLGYIAENGGTMQQDSTTSFTDDVSWVVGSSLA